MNNLQPLINESVQLLFIGMGTVFIILIMLIFLINLVSKALSMLKLEDEPVKTRNSQKGTRKKSVKSDDELIAVISSSITAYKKKHSV